MAERRGMRVEDLIAFRFPGDPHLHPDGRRVAFVLSEFDTRHNGYKSSIWMAGAGAAPGAGPVAGVGMPPAGGLGAAAAGAAEASVPAAQATEGAPADGAAAPSGTATTPAGPDAAPDGAGTPAPRRLTYGGRRDRRPRWSPDGSRLAFLSDRSGEDQIWTLAPGGGEARQLTRRKGGVSAFAWAPDGSRLAAVGRDPRPEPGPGPAPDARYITRLRYKANGAGYHDDRRTHLYTVDAATGECTQVTWGPFDDGEPTWSPDGDALCFASARGDEADPWFGPDLYVVPAAGGPARQLFGKPGGCSAPAWSPDGGQIAFLGGAGRAAGENMHLWVVPAAGGEPRCVTAAHDMHAGCAVGSDLRRDAGSAGPLWIDGGRAVLAVFADGPSARVYRCELATGAASVAAGAGEGSITSFSATADGDRIAAVRGDALHPAELWAFAAPAGPGRPAASAGAPAGAPPRAWEAPPPAGASTVQPAAVATPPTPPGPAVRPPASATGTPLTAFNAETLAGLDLALPEHVPFRSFDGQPIDAWVLRPVGAEPGRRYPLVLEIHGGPHGAYGHGMCHELQALAARGYGVLYTNPRGSIGYGEAFTQAVVDDWGGGDYRDVMAAVDMACGWDWVDTTRLGVTGGSYGGFLTNWIIGQTPRFAAAVTQRSICNFYTKYGVADNGWMHNAREMGGADLWADEDKIMARSPIRYARNVRTPTLIIHSEEDYRCPLEQGEQWYTALRRLGVPTAMVRFAGENHELSRSGKPANRLERLRRMIAWFDRYLRAGAAG